MDVGLPWGFFLSGPAVAPVRLKFTTTCENRDAHLIVPARIVPAGFKLPLLPTGAISLTARSIERSGSRRRADHRRPLVRRLLAGSPPGQRALAQRPGRRRGRGSRSGQPQRLSARNHLAASYVSANRFAEGIVDSPRCSGRAQPTAPPSWAAASPISRRRSSIRRRPTSEPSWSSQRRVSSRRRIPSSSRPTTSSG